MYQPRRPMRAGAVAGVSRTRGHTNRRVRHAAACLVVALSLAAAAPSSASAAAGSGSTQCSAYYGSIHPTDISCITAKNGEQYTASDDEWVDNNVNIHWDATNHNQFILHGEWFYTKTDYSYWVEVNMLYGTCLAIWGTSIMNICPSTYDVTKPHAYRAWADYDNGNQYAHFIGPWTVSTGNWHDYEIQRDPNNLCDYFVWIDGNKEGTSTNQYCPGGYSYGYEVDVGLEHNGANYDSDFYADTNTDLNLETWHDGAWHPWGYHYEWNKNEPCDSSHSTNCYNGTAGGYNYQWITNRPWSG